MKIYRLGACLKCRGDLALDHGDWICLQCGVYYYTGLYSHQGDCGPDDPGNSTLLISRIQPSVRTGGPQSAARLAS